MEQTGDREGGATAAEGSGERRQDFGASTSGSCRRLPQRLIRLGCYPQGPRLNIYSKPAVLGSIAAALKGRVQLEQLLSSQFGGLFRLPVSRCRYSAKLIHALLCRQLVTKKKYEMWTLFGCNPLRFSLREFGKVTGLNCGVKPVKQNNSESERMWPRLFGSRKEVTVDQVLGMLNDPELEEGMRLPLALIAIVDGVLMCNEKHLKVNAEHVEMLANVPFFMEYPWGRESFQRTLSRFVPQALSESVQAPLAELRERLNQQTMVCYGFPLALQLIALECIPSLLQIFPEGDKATTFVDLALQEETRSAKSTTANLLLSDILKVEEDPQLAVQFDVSMDGEHWVDEVADEEVSKLLGMLRQGHRFVPSDFSDAGENGGEHPCEANPPSQPKASEGARRQGRVRSPQKHFSVTATTRTLRPRQQKVAPSASSTHDTPGPSARPVYRNHSKPGVRSSEIDKLKEWMTEWMPGLLSTLKAEIVADVIAAIKEDHQPAQHKGQKRKEREDEPQTRNGKGVKGSGGTEGKKKRKIIESEEENDELMREENAEDNFSPVDGQGSWSLGILHEHEEPGDNVGEEQNIHLPDLDVTPGKEVDHEQVEKGFDDAEGRPGVQSEGDTRAEVKEDGEVKGGVSKNDGNTAKEAPDGGGQPAMEATTAVAIEEEENFYDAAETQDVSTSNDQRLPGEKEEGNVGDSKPDGLESAKGTPSEPQEGKTKEDDVLEEGKGMGEKKEEEKNKQLIVYPRPLSYVTPEPVETEKGTDSKEWDTPLAETLKGAGKRKKMLSRKIGGGISPEMWMKDMFKSNNKAGYSCLDSVNQDEFKKFAGILKKSKKQ